MTAAPARVGPLRRTVWGVTLLEWIVLALLAAATLHVWYHWGTERTGLFKDDTGYYAQLVESLWSPARLPYSFRILTPWLVSVLPLDVVSGFTLITVVSLIAATLLLHAYLAMLKFSAAVRWLCLALFLASGLVVRALTTPMYVDPLTYALHMLALIALLRRNDPLFLIAISLAVLNRETALLLLPVYVATYVREGLRRALLRAALMAVVPVALLALTVGLKLVSVASLGQDALNEMLRYTGGAQRVPRLGDLLDLYSLFGILWVIALVRVRDGWREHRPLMIFGFLVIAQLTVSRGDESRNLSHLFPTLFVLVALELQWLRQRMQHVRGLVGLSALAGASMIHFRWTFLSPEVVRYALIALGTLGGLATWWALRRQARAGPETTAH